MFIRNFLLSLTVYTIVDVQALGVLLPSSNVAPVSKTSLSSSYLDEINLFKTAEKKCLVGFTTDAWNIGQKKYKDFLAVHKMVKRVQKNNMACVEVPLWEINNGPHFDELQTMLESFWIPDYSSKNNFLLQFDLVVIPDPVIAKYMVEAYYEKEAKVEKKKAYYSKLMKQPWGVIDAYPPKERLEWERIRALSKQKWVRKFPPIATLGDDAFQRMKNHGQVEYFAYGVEDFALYLPKKLVPTRRVLLLRFRNRFDTLIQSLVMSGVNVTSAYPVTWMKKVWSPQEERIAKEVDVVYFHEAHAVAEWRARMGTRADGDAVAACHDEEVARACKQHGFKDIFYAKKSDTDGLTKTVTQAVEFVKSRDLVNGGK